LALELGMAPFVPGAVPVPVVLEQVEVSGMEQACRAARGAVRLRHRLTTWKARRYWRRALRRYAALTVVSEEEAAAVRHVLGPTPGGPAVEVVPNGVAVSSYRKRTTASHRSDVARVVPGRLIYNGSLSYAPNLDAVRWFAAEILPRIVLQVPEAHLVVTGGIPARRWTTFVRTRGSASPASFRICGPSWRRPRCASYRFGPAAVRV
jgi:hypothetical protein